MKWFTLVELLVVICIVGLLFTVTLNLSRWSIHDVEVRQERDDFTNTYNQLLSKSLTSKYYNNSDIYSGIVLTFTSGSNARTSAYILWDNTSTGETTHTLKNAKFGTGNILIQLAPYKIWCQSIYSFNAWDISQKEIETGAQKIQIEGIKSIKKYCFIIDPPTCKLQETTCE